VTDPPTTSGPQYEFSEEQNKIIARVSSGFRIVGFVLVIEVIRAAISLVSGVYYLSTGNGRQVTGYQVVGYGALLVLLAPLAVWMFMASSSFQSIVETKGSDIDHLMSGLRMISKSFNWVIGLGLFAIAVELVLLVLHIFGVL
jgi:hypothetical protein